MAYVSPIGIYRDAIAPSRDALFHRAEYSLHGSLEDVACCRAYYAMLHDNDGLHTISLFLIR